MIVEEKNQRTVANVVSKFGETSKQVLLDDIWERPGLNKRDRSLITVDSHVARHRTA